MSTYVRHSQIRAARRVISSQWRVGIMQRRCLQQATANTDPSIRNEPPIEGNGQTVRLAVKDNISALGFSTTCASNILYGNKTPFDATIVRQIRQRGAAVTAKAGMDEFGMGTHSTTSAFEDIHNVCGLEKYSAGGSSGGSAVAVRKGEAELALGTDTGGSVRMPAAYTGTVGFKPSYGMLSRWGVVPYANSLDTVGLLARTVDPIGAAIVEQKLHLEHDPNDPTSLPSHVRQRCTAERRGYDSWDPSRDGTIQGLTFGIPIEYNIEELDPRIRQGWLMAAQKIEELGGRIVPVSLPSTKNALSAYYVIAPAEAASNLAKYDGIRYGQRNSEQASDSFEGILYAKTRETGFGSEVKRRILLGSYTLSSEAIDNYFIQAQKVRRLVRRDFDRVFKLSNPLEDQQPFDLSEMEDTIQLENKFGPAQVDFLLSPTAPTTPPLLEDVMRQTPLDSYMNDVFTVPASLAGLPAISIPMDIPVDPTKEEQKLLNFGGMQLVGQYWDDARLLSVADVLAPRILQQSLF
ncbi:Glutamyl-tRNA(Gln) amidotransferase subunit A, mitochondrial [Daldinia childiae]|uniref:Glutamyl-tRNA(Gln) amidotransferase subunit A, mitochondrial n=1 Tax=Daldinia childiae TaxID=326645 RepID=UPI001446A04E|nr:Glutamyl-tRNA(Gln) amidotransferase subunit A, mitochondrial [Daldinia childiae]KAF3062254.1 Glutamyl-tRNA(Gln) amidotransferase subunit A, mitochondrial [Daldinia childiae]